MWQIIAISSLLFYAIDVIIDKKALIADKSIDDVFASFIRTVLFLMWTTIISLTGLFGKIELVITMPIFLLAISWIIGSIIYGKLLKKIEATSDVVLSYITPFLFLILDFILIKAHLSFAQIIGVVLLSTGGVIFVLDPKTFKLKKQFTKTVILMFCYNFVLSAFEYYLFKHYDNLNIVEEGSFLISTWTIMSIILLAVILFTHRRKILLSTQSWVYTKRVTASKFFDAVQSLLWYKALALTTVAQINALSAVTPIILLICVFITQKVFKIDLEEELKPNHLILKITSIVIIAIGTLLI